ncbi:MAG: O-antigen ligase family protein [Acidimicrobiia bacterium]
MRRTARLIRFALIAGFVVGVQGAVALLLSQRVAVGLGVTALLIGAVFAAGTPVTIALLVWPATWFAHRVGPASFDLSVTDALLLVAGLAALPVLNWRSPAVRKVVTGLVVYEAMILTTVLATPSTRATLEWLHRAHLVLGGMAVGMLIAQRGKLRLVIRVFVTVSVAYALAAVTYTLTHHLRPAYPFGSHKNAAGSLIALAIIVLLAAPKAHGLRGDSVGALSAVLFAGLLGTQARGAALALVVMIAALALGKQRGSGLRVMAGIGVLAIVAMLGATYVTRDAKAANDQFSSINSRRLTYDYSIDLWKTKPLTGVGLRFWSDPNVKLEGRRTFGEPHDFVVSALGETGVIGLAALAALLWQMFAALRLVGGEMGRLARLAFLGLLVDSLFGILWVAGTFTARMVLVGMALGAATVRASDKAGATDERVLDLREKFALT